MQYYKQIIFPPRGLPQLLYYRVREQAMRIDTVKMDSAGEYILPYPALPEQYDSRGVFNFRVEKLKATAQPVPVSVAEPIFAEYDKKRNGGVSVG
jgi:hypothetical protein